jgi:hypothetical protein
VDETSSVLLQRCASAARDGADFPTVWDSILRRHRLVTGPPVQAIRDGHPRLEIPLMTGQSIVFDSSSGEYSIA